ncbi:hypothetical protein D7V78_08040 [Parabacteroides distasonis]|uniref:Uncharacterized protein n=1 Tax=Parabacteroides distasonis TaxID=823 RepID=A0A3L7ZS79_PARDI|nr:hypothetical protein [Parabacteroides distasonis]RLT73777.1 hypothetical protein D7V78_08040 [Parabacteroides distasonis]
MGLMSKGIIRLIRIRQIMIISLLKRTEIHIHGKKEKKLKTIRKRLIDMDKGEEFKQVQKEDNTMLMIREGKFMYLKEKIVYEKCILCYFIEYVFFINLFSANSK